MAIKLTDKVINKLIMEALEEISQTSGGSFDPSASDRQRGLPFTKKGPKLGGAVSDMEQLFNMIQDDPKVPAYIKDFATDVFIKTGSSTAKEKTDTEWDLEELPADTEITPLGHEPTARIDLGGRPTVKMSDMPTARMPSPQAFGGPNKGRPPAPALSKPGSGFFGKLKKAVGLEEEGKAMQDQQVSLANILVGKKSLEEEGKAMQGQQVSLANILVGKKSAAVAKNSASGLKEERMIETLIAEVLEEISDKERRGLEAHYGPDMRGAKASKKQLDKIDAAIKEKKERLKKLKDLKGLRGHYGEDMSGKKQNDKKIAELEKEIEKLETELGTKKKSSTGTK